MPAALAGGGNVARKDGKLLDERIDGREGWLSHNWIDQDVLHASVHHFGDVGHGGCDGHHIFCWENVVAVLREYQLSLLVMALPWITINTR